MNLQRREKNRLWLGLKLYAKIYFETLRKLESELFDRGRNSRTKCRKQVESDYMSTAMMPGRLSGWTVNGRMRVFKSNCTTFTVIGRMSPVWHFLGFLSLTLSRRDLNASCSGCLPEFFLGFFKFQCKLLEKKIVSHRLFLQI